jgi:hypothetical protein
MHDECPPNSVSEAKTPLWPNGVEFESRNPSVAICGSEFHRDVAQPGSALAWGARGREFKSRRPDQFN